MTGETRVGPAARRRLLALAGAAMLAGALAGAGIAVVAGQGDTVQACAQKVNGQLRMVASPEDCRPSENPVALAAAGSAGGGPLAYVHVESGQLDTARSSGVVSMTTAVDSQLSGAVIWVAWCFDLVAIPANVVTAQETGGTYSAAVGGTAAMADSPCPAGTDAAILYPAAPHEIPGIFDVAGFFALFH